MVGQQQVLEEVMMCLLAGGHALLVGVPGLAKTLLVRTLSEALELDFKRVQFTPDLMPGDITGTEVIEEDRTTGRRSARFIRGPIFTQVLLADEINRTPPKTQAALLEAMQERTVTLDGTRHDLGERFMVVATQNPIEQQGVYPLPEAQLDRFLFKQTLPYPSAEEEKAIVARFGMRTGQPDPTEMGVETVVAAEELARIADLLASVRLTDEIGAYVVAIVRGTREAADFETGVSPRCAAVLAAASRARAVLNGRDYVIPDDVKALALPALRHRVILSPAAEIEGRKVDDALTALISQIEAPR
ncbi:MAG TPA: MoxR family ATPase [Caulobacter sp.]|nr:MoxR family ATPase [Caulobacter sp.]